MRIIVKEIPEEGLDVQAEEQLEVEALGAPVKARISLHLEKLGEDVLVRGDVSAGLLLQCGRCLADFQDEIRIDMDLAYSPIEGLGEDEKQELHSGDLEAGYYREGELDLGEVAREQVLLNIPMRPLCSDSCKGLCPHCGANLNETTCGCEQKSIDPRMKALEKLMTKRKEQT